MGRTPKEDLSPSPSQNGTSIDRSLELAAVAIMARNLLGGNIPPDVLHGANPGDRQLFEFGIGNTVFGPTNVDSIPPGNARLIASLGLTEGESPPPARRKRNSGRENGTRRARPAA